MLDIGLTILIFRVNEACLILQLKKKTQQLIILTK
jgi:hypothetical protein